MEIKRMKIAIAAVLLASLAACGGSQIQGTKAGAGQAEFSNDFLACRAMSQRVFDRQDQGAIVECMQAKNWQIKVCDGACNKG